MSSIASRSRSGTLTNPQLPGRLGYGSTSSLNLRGSSNHLPLEPVSETESTQAHSPIPLVAELPPTPATPGESAHSYSGSAVTSSTSLGPPIGRGTEDEDLSALEAEMADIRRRRTEVTARYEARIEYLRARLKGAELREKLLKR